MHELYLIFTSLSFILVVLALVCTVVTDKQVFMWGVLFVLPLLCFLYLGMKNTSPIRYQAQEKICGQYQFKTSDPSRGSKGHYPIIHYFSFEEYGLHSFYDQEFKEGVNFAHLSKQDRVCFILMRKVDEPNNLSNAKLISALK
ncbi:hypothetical protein [Acinetobacter sp.]|uniref:hypothetical protein n=1 Tax=Acinetobacter sp. TaxID=472 RepID=UPI00388D209B